MTWPVPQYRWPTLPAFGPAVQPAPAPGTAVAPAPELQDPRTLSASQVDTFLDCKRKWAFKSLWKIFAPPDPSAQLGTCIHGIAEDYLTSGKQPDLYKELRLPKGRGAPGENVFYPGQIFQAGMIHLPAPGTVHVEGRKKWQTPAGHHWTGQLDGLTFRYADQTLHPHSDIAAATWGRGLGRFEVWDHKSTSKFAYVKGVEATKDSIALRDDVQANLYAWATMAEFGVNEVDLRWLYYRTRDRPASRLTAITVTRPWVSDKIAFIDQTAMEMLDLYQHKPEIKEIEPDASKCDKYGGCPYRERCPLTITQRFSAPAKPFGTALPLAPTTPSLFTSSPGNETMTQPAAPAMPASLANIVAQLQAQQPASAPPPGSLTAALTPAPAAQPQPAPTAPAQQVAPAAAPAFGAPLSVGTGLPATWMPGSSLNTAQAWMVTQAGCTWFGLAMAADPGTAPDQATAQAFDAMLLPPNQTGGTPVPRNSAQVWAAPSAPAGNVTPSVGGINPPDAPRTMPAQASELPPRIELPASMAPAAPAQVQLAPGADTFAGMDRDALKALCVQRGLCSTGCRKRDVDVFKRALHTGQPIPDAGEGEGTPPSSAPAAQLAPAAQSVAPAQQTIPHTEHVAAPAAQPAPSVLQQVVAQGAAMFPEPPKAAYTGGFTLYVYCMPTKGTNHARTLRLADIMGALVPQIRQVLGGPHYAMADYGKGRALFAGLLEEFLAGTNIGPETGIVLERSSEAADAVTVLERYAGQVTRGL